MRLIQRRGGGHLENHRREPLTIVSFSVERVSARRLRKKTASAARTAPQNLLLTARFERATLEIAVAPLDLEAVVVEQCLELARKKV